MEWIVIKDFPNYEVSRDGRVRRIGQEKLLKLHMTKSGCWMVSLWHEGKSKNKSIHRLVYDAFVGIENPQNDVRHIDKNPGNASLDNLNEATRSETTKNRGKGKPVQHGIEQYSLDGQLIKVWGTASEAAKFFGGAYQNIVACYWGQQNQAFGYVWKCSIKLTDTSEFKVLELGDDLVGYKINPEGVVINKRNKVMSQNECNGYMRTTLTDTGGKKRTFSIHRLLAKTFHAREDEKKDVVNHLDENPLNNHLDNIEWTTTAGNIQHSMAVKVNKIDLSTGEVLHTYTCISDAYRDLGKTYGGGISHVCRGEQKTAFGFGWSYA